MEQSRRAWTLGRPFYRCPCYENLKKHGVHIIDVEHGELASGLVGKGRMAEPEAITAKVADFFFGKNQPKPLANKHILVTAGPTQDR